MIVTPMNEHALPVLSLGWISPVAAPRGGMVVGNVWSVSIPDRWYGTVVGASVPLLHTHIPPSPPAEAAEVSGAYCMYIHT